MFKKNLLKLMGAVCLASMLFMTACEKPDAANKGENAEADISQNDESLDSCDTYEAMSYEGYKLEKVVVLSRHGIRAPHYEEGSVLATITPHQWYEWSAKPAQLSLKGGVLETQMGQYFRKWMEKEGLFSENFLPEEGQVRIYANSKQRTIATAEYFAAGLLPCANTQVEYHEEFDKMDPVFNPQFTFMNDAYNADVEAQVNELFGDKIKDLEDNFDLLTNVIDLKNSEGYKSGEIGDFKTDDNVFAFELGEEPKVSGSLMRGCTVSDALVLQYYEEEDAGKADFGNNLKLEDWESIAEIKDLYVDALVTAPLVSANVAHPLLAEINKEMNTQGRLFTFLCGHDSNLDSVLASLDVKDYSLPNSIEKKTPIGSKLVFSQWTNESGNKFWSVDLIYQTVDQLRNNTMLDAQCGPCIYHLEFEGLTPNEAGLYADSDLNARFTQAISEYDEIVAKYTAASEQAA